MSGFESLVGRRDDAEIIFTVNFGFSSNRMSLVLQPVV